MGPTTEPRVPAEVPAEAPVLPPVPHDEWLLDEALLETFPASDPIAASCASHPAP
jgi:hypothetical protein